MNYVSSQSFLYFGCWTDTGGGHYLWNTRGDHAGHTERQKLPWDQIDGVLQPGCNLHGKDMYPRRQEIQGHAALHHKEGWTALCFWDRSEDIRGGCNSNFFARGIFNFDEMVQMAKAMFPIVWERFNFPVLLVWNNGLPVPDIMTMEEKAADYARVVDELKTVLKERDKLREKLAEVPFLTGQER
jgi:hypothetical protein